MADSETSESNIQDFILERELAEVYLLLDNVATAGNKELPSATADPLFKDTDKSWLEQVCDIAWPPHEHEQANDARNAAKLLRAKDFLNLAARPATGASIAFTQMMAGEDRNPYKDKNWWRSLLLWLAGEDGWELYSWRHPSRRAQDSRLQPPPPPPPHGAPASAPSRKPAPTRASLAAQAYPILARKAWRYRLMLNGLIMFLVFWLFVTCLFSWDVATGGSLLNRVNYLNVQILNFEEPKKSSLQKSPDMTSKREESISVLNGELTSASENLQIWLDKKQYIRNIVKNVIGTTDESALIGKNVNEKTVNVEWAAVFIGILVNIVLPVFYGLLGANAAVVRILSARMRENTLMPRHIYLAYIQLTLGAVIGACVGLFVAPDGSATSGPQGLLGSIHLSASALCFVAGFGVEGVFQSLEGLVKRVFNLDSPKA